MTDVLITLKVMPEDLEVSLDHLFNEVAKKIESFGGKIKSKEFQPVAFGITICPFSPTVIISVILVGNSYNYKKISIFVFIVFNQKSITPQPGFEPGSKAPQALMLS